MNLYQFKTQSSRALRRTTAYLKVTLHLFGGVAFLWTSTVQANPAGEQVVAGAAGFERVGGALTITQGTDRAVINWNSFSIGAGEITKFVQPNSSSAVLNRVITANNPSAIYGTLQANGQVYLINPAGIFIGPGGLVDTAGFVASTHDVGDKEFMAGGDLNFTGSSGASIVNQGRIEAKQGDVFLVARQVSNEGQIMASDGTVGMISGTEVCLHSIGPNNYKVRLIDVANDTGVQKTDNGIADVVNAGVIEAANAELESTGNYLSLAIKNTGVIRATGVVPNADGTVTLTGGEGDILNTGVVAAIQKNIQGETVGGRILASAKNITTDPGSIMTASGSEKGGEIKVSASDTIYAGGKIEAKSDEGKGGKIQLTGERVGLFKAEVDASGNTAGGTVLVGGDYLGKNPEVPNAKAVVMTSDSVIRANATGNGDGGKVILWSDEYTGFYGRIFARAGLSGGNGGFVETSSKDNLQAWGAVDTLSFFGKAGLWLLDPTELYITTTSSNVDISGGPPGPWIYQPTAGSSISQSQANANTILQALDAGQNVTIQVNTATGTADTVGNIYVARPLNVDTTPGTLGLTQGNLTLLAGGASIAYTAGVPNQGLGVVGGSGAGSIFVNEAISVGGSLTMIAGNDPGLSATASGVTTVTGGTGGSITISAPITSLNGVVTLQAGWGLAPDGGASGGSVTINSTVTTSGANGKVLINAGSANGSGSGGTGTAGVVTVNSTITLGTENVGTDPITGYLGSVIAAGNGSGQGGNLVINAPINGNLGTLTLQSGTGPGESAGTFTINSNGTVGQANSVSTRLAATFFRSQTTLDLSADVYSERIVLVPTPTPTATGSVNNGSIWINETPILGLNSFSVDSAVVSRLFANLLITDAIEIGDTTFTGDIAIGQAGEVSFSSSNLKFIGSAAAPTLNRAISFNATSGTCLSFSPAIAGGKITFDTGGRLYTRFGTASVDIASSGGTIDFLRVSGIGQTSSQPLRTDVANIQGVVNNGGLSTAGNVFLANSGALNFSDDFTVTVTGIVGTSVNLTAGGDITQSSGTVITTPLDAFTVFNASGNDVNLGLQNNVFFANNFGTVAFSSVKNATISDTGAIILGASTLTGGLTVNAGGNVTQTGALVVPGTTTVTASAGNIDLANNGGSNDFTGAVNLSTTGNNAISIRDENSMVLGNLSTAAGSASVTIQVGTSGVGGSSLTQQSGTSITSLATAGNFTIVATGPTTSVNLATDSFGTSLANNIASGNVVMTGGSNFQDFALRNIAATADTPSATTALTLRNLTLIYNNNLIRLPASNFNNLTGNLVLTAGGNISQLGDLTVGGSSTITATAGGITLFQSANDFQGAVTLTAKGNGSIFIQNANALNIGGISTEGATLGSISTGSLTIRVATALTQSGAINTGTGGVTINATAANTDIRLASYDNAIRAGSITFTTPANVRDYAIRSTFAGADADAGVRAALTNLRNLTVLYDAAAINLPALTLDGDGTQIGSLVLSSGNILGVQQGGAWVVPGTTSITATTGVITLIQNNNFTGAVSLTTPSTNLNAVQITDQNLLTLGTLSIGGNLTANSTGALNLGLGSVGGDLTTANSNGGMITQTGALTINGTSSITAGAAAITLTQSLNDFIGAVSLSNTGNNDVSITDANALTLGNLSVGVAVPPAVGGGRLFANSTGALNLGSGTVTGALSAASNGGAISQTGGLTLSSSSDFNSGSGSVTLTAGLGGAAQNSFGGAVSLTAGNADFYMASGAAGVDQLAQTAGSTVVAGTFTLRSPINTDFSLAKGVGVFKLTPTQLANMSVGTLAARASGAGNLIVGAFNPAGVSALNLITTGTGNITADSVTIGSLSMNSGGTVAFTQPNQVRNLGTLVVGSGGLTFQNQNSLNLTGSASMTGRLSLEVAGQFYNQTGAESPLAGVQLGSVIKSLSLMGGLPNSVSGLAGFSYRYDGVIPTSGNVMSYAVSPLALFAPSGTVIAGVDLSGTQTGGGQFNTFLTGSDDLNWIISDFGKFNLPKVSSAGLEYTIYPKRVEPETRTLPNSTLSQLRQELGRPPTIDEINRREVSMRESDRLRSGSILERSSLDSAEESNEPQENAKTTTPSPIEGQIPQANQEPKKVVPTEDSSFELTPPMASSQVLPDDSFQPKADERAAVSELLVKERANAEVGLAIPVARSK